jgi:hypothetical protein
MCYLGLLTLDVFAAPDSSNIIPSCQFIGIFGIAVRGVRGGRQCGDDAVSVGETT